MAHSRREQRQRRDQASTGARSWLEWKGGALGTEVTECRDDRTESLPFATCHLRERETRRQVEKRNGKEPGPMLSGKMEQALDVVVVVECRLGDHGGTPLVPHLGAGRAHQPNPPRAGAYSPIRVFVVDEESLI